MSIAYLRQCLALFCVTLVAVFANAEPSSEFLKIVLSKKHGVSEQQFMSAAAKMEAAKPERVPGFCSQYLTGFFAADYGAEVYIERPAGPKTAESLKQSRIEVQIENPNSEGPYKQTRIRVYIPTVMVLSSGTVNEKIEFDIISLIPKSGLTPQQRAAQFTAAEERIVEVRNDLESFMAERWPGHEKAFTISSSSVRGPYWRLHTLTLVPELNDPEVALSLIQYIGSR